MKQVFKNFFLLVALYSCTLVVQGQVKTKIFDNGIPDNLLFGKMDNMQVIEIEAPESLKQAQESEKNKNLSDYSNKFAISKDVDFDILKMAKLFQEKDTLHYNVFIKAKEAMNISVQFSEFVISENAILSIYTSKELTDSITKKENNKNNIWATRVYQGNEITITLKVPLSEKNRSTLKINKVFFGYKQFGSSFFGNPDASATCNVNVACAAGNGWENERNSVALIVVDGFEQCTGTLVMNTCGTNIPYLLTANHCLGAGNVQNWVFQFQTWSNICTPNGTFREDIQFNGSTLKANNCELDFALLEMSQTPAANSGITYAGWSRSTTPPTSGTSLHHPRGDLMKISLFNSSAVSVAWLEPFNSCPSTTSNHWRVEFNQGIVQHGSSGAALFNEDHRIVGQLHGNQNNICGNPGTNNCWCTTQIPSVGEFGRFDLSWTGGGTNSTRLSNWLDPSHSNAMTINTTAVNNLTTAPFPNILSIEISPVYGEDCNSMKVSANVASNTSLTWTTTGGLLINGLASPQTITGNSVTITSPVGGDGYVQATFNNCVPSNNLFFCPCPTWPGNPQITWIWSSPAQGEPLVAYVSPADPNVDRYIWMVDGQIIQDGPETDLLAYDYPCTWEKDLIVIAVYGCGASAPVNGGPYSPLCSGSRSVQNVVVYPNPASSVLNVKLKESGFLGEKGEKQQGNLSQILSITLFDKTGKQKKKLPFTKGNRQVEIIVSELPSDVYYLEVSDGIQKTRIPVIIKR